MFKNYAIGFEYFPAHFAMRFTGQIEFFHVIISKGRVLYVNNYNDTVIKRTDTCP